MLCLDCQTESRVYLFCGFYRVCPTCARLRAKNLVRELGEDAGKIEERDRQRVERVRPLVEGLQTQMTALMGLLVGFRSAGVRGELGRLKAALGEAVDAILGDLAGEALRQHLDPRPAIRHLREFKRRLRSNGLARAGLGSEAAKAHRALGACIAYRWRLITVTIQTLGRYDWAVDKALDAFSKLVESTLSVPGFALVRSLEFGPNNGNVHIHAMNFGPYIPQEEIKTKWMDLTGSYVVDVREVDESEGLEGGLREVGKYLVKFTEAGPDQLQKYVHALRGRRAVERYGGFRAVRTKTPPPQPVAVAQQLDGTCHLLYDVPRCPACGSAEVVVVELIPPGDPPQTGRAGPDGAEDAGSG